MDQSAEKSQDAGPCNRPAPPIHTHTHKDRHNSLTLACARSRRSRSRRTSPPAAPQQFVSTIRRWELLLAHHAQGRSHPKLQCIAGARLRRRPAPPCKVAARGGGLSSAWRRPLTSPSLLGGSPCPAAHPKAAAPPRPTLPAPAPLAPRSQPWRGKGSQREGEKIVFFSPSNSACLIKSFVFPPSPPHTHPSARPHPARHQKTAGPPPRLIACRKPPLSALSARLEWR